MSEELEAGNEGGLEEGQAAEAAPQEYEVVIDGETHRVGIDELRNGYMRQSDYTRKTQGLSEEREWYQKQVEEEATRLYLKAQEEDRLARGETQDAGKLMEERMNKMRQELDQTRSQIQAEKDDAELRQITEGLSSKYPKADIQKVLIRFHNEAQDHEDAGEVFNRIAAEEQKAFEANRQAIIDEYVKEKQKSPFTAGEVGGAAPGTTDGKLSNPPKTFAEARERAEARLRHLHGG